MVRKAAGGALWLAKGAAVFWGAVVTLAVVLGVGTTALAAVPGDPFRLGRVNVISNATTTLQGTAPNGGALLSLERSSGIGPVLKVEATNQGIARRGIDITVPAGQSPVSANNDAGKANLNVNLLDGKDSSAFLPGETYTKFGDTITFSDRQVRFVRASCDPGDVALSGGHDFSTTETPVVLREITQFNQHELEIIAPRENSINAQAAVVCADLPPLR
jgi:hypothetical protein